MVKKAWEKFREVIPARASKVVAITDEENEKLIQHAGTALERAIRIVRGTGCRPAEVGTLTARHLDFEKRTVQIGSGLVSCDDNLFSWLKWLAKDVSRDLLLSNNGQRWTAGLLHRKFVRIRDRLGMRKDLTLFSVRHGYALKFMENGGSVADLAAILGIGEKQVMKLYGSGTSDHSKLKGHESFKPGERSGTSPAMAPGSPLGESESISCMFWLP